MREGGQYTFGRQAEASVSLIQSAPTATDDTRTQTIADPEPTVQPETLTINPDFGQERADLLASKGYVPAISVDKIQESEARDWWDKHETLGEYGERNRSVMRMPNNATPNMTPGRGDGGTRMTHRRTYEGGGTSIRMPSVTSIRRASALNNDVTMAVPVRYKDDQGNEVECDVHVTQSAPGRWHVSAMGVEDEALSAHISESVQASLEARRIGNALQNVDWAERRRQMHASEGKILHPLPNGSSFVSGVAYNRASGLLVMEMNGRHYGYNIDPATYRQLLESSSPGKVYNELIRKRTGSTPVQQCEKCQRFTSAKEPHRCPGFHKTLKGTGASATRSARQRASLVAERQGSTLYRGKDGSASPRSASPLTVWDSQTVNHVTKDSGWTRPAVQALENGHIYEVDSKNNHYGFRGVGRQTAGNLYRSLPSHVLHASHHGAPPLSKMLHLTKNFSSVEVLGRLNSPNSKDEGVQGTGLRIRDSNLVANMRSLSGKVSGEKLDQQMWLKVSSVTDLPVGKTLPKTRIVRTTEGEEAVELSWV